jgi:hypothetical protein
MPAVLSYSTLEPTTDDNKFDLLAKLLLATLAGGGGGTVALANVTGISDFWKATLSGTPAANQVFGTDGAGVFTTFPVTTVGTQLLNLVTSGSDSVIALTAADAIDLYPPATTGEFIAGGSVFTGTQNPVTEIVVANGVVTGAS